MALATETPTVLLEEAVYNVANFKNTICCAITAFSIHVWWSGLIVCANIINAVEHYIPAE